MKRSWIHLIVVTLLASPGFASHAALPTVPTAVAEPAWSSGAGGMLQATLGLVLVVGLIFLCGWAVRRFGLQPNGNGRLLKVVASTMVGQRERVVVVEIGNAWLVLGVAAGQVRALHTMAARELATVPATPLHHGVEGGNAFSQKLRQSLDQLHKLGKRA